MKMLLRLSLIFEWFMTTVFCAIGDMAFVSIWPSLGPTKSGDHYLALAFALVVLIRLKQISPKRQEPEA